MKDELFESDLAIDRNAYILVNSSFIQIKFFGDIYIQHLKKTGTVKI